MLSFILFICAQPTVSLGLKPKVEHNRKENENKSLSTIPSLGIIINSWGAHISFISFFYAPQLRVDGQEKLSLTSSVLLVLLAAGIKPGLMASQLIARAKARCQGKVGRKHFILLPLDLLFFPFLLMVEHMEEEMKVFMRPTLHKDR